MSKESEGGIELKEEKEKEALLTTATAHTLLSCTKSMWTLAWPNALTFIMWPLHSVIGLYYVGRMNNVKHIDAITLAISWISIFGFSIQIGIACALDTLLTQSMGQKAYATCGLILNRAFLIITLVSVPCAVLVSLSGPICILFGIDKEVAYECEWYCVAMLPGLFVNIPWILLEKFLNAQQIVRPQMCIQMFNTALYPLYCYVCINVLELSYLGAAAAKTISEVFYVLVLMAYIHYSKCCELTLVPLTREAFAGWTEYMTLAIPTMFTICLEWWAWEILNLLCGRLGLAQLGANGISLNIGSIMLIVQAGIGSSTGVLVGSSIGAGDILNAKRYAMLGVVYGAICITVIAVVVVTYRHFFASLFTMDTTLLTILDTLLYIVALDLVLDNISGILLHVLLGIGRQDSASYINLICYYVIMLPLAVILGFPLGLGVQGVWVGCIIAVLIVGGCYCRIIFTVNWELLVKEAHNRIERNQTAI